MNTHDRKINVVEELIVVFDRKTWAEEDHHFFGSVFLEESEQH